MKKDFRAMVDDRFKQGLYVSSCLPYSMGKKSVLEQCNYIDGAIHLVASFMSDNPFAASSRCESVPIISSGYCDSVDAVIADPYTATKPTIFIFLHCCTSDGGFCGLQNSSMKVMPNENEEDSLFDQLMRINGYNELPVYLYVAYQVARRGQGLIMNVKNVDQIFQVRKFVGQDVLMYLSGFGTDVPIDKLGLLLPALEASGKNTLVEMPSRVSHGLVIQVNNLVEEIVQRQLLEEQKEEQEKR